MLYLNNDYNEICHPAVLKKITDCAMLQNPGYGTDGYCGHVAELIRKKCNAPNMARCIPCPS